jgi:hypothetical protein
MGSKPSTTTEPTPRVHALGDRSECAPSAPYVLVIIVAFGWGRRRIRGLAEGGLLAVREGKGA